MFTSEKTAKQTMRTLYIYIGATLFVALFGFIYELFSNHVYSASMYLAWMYPCFIGVPVYAALRFLPIKIVPGTIPACIFNFGVALITTRSIFNGVLEIYGKTNYKMQMTYTVLTIIFLAVGSALYLFIVIYYWLIKSPKNTQAE